MDSRASFLTRREKIGAAVAAGAVALPIPFVVAGFDVARGWLFLLAGTVTFLVLVNLVARLSGEIVPLYCFAVGLGLAGLAVTIAVPSYIITDTGAVTRYWPDFFLGFAFSTAFTPLAAYERVPAIRERWGRRLGRRDSPPMG